MNKQLLVFATLLEAKSTLIKCSAIEKRSNFFQADQYDILITGMGVEKTLRALSATPLYNSIINIGFCGALSELKFGEFYEVASVEKHQQESFSLNHTGRFSEKKLVTYDFPVHDKALKDLLAKKYDMVDMEGWAVAAFSSQNNISCQLIKIVSDFCSKTTSQEIQSKGAILSNIIASIF